jgi:hypothetical protein
MSLIRIQTVCARVLCVRFILGGPSHMLYIV